MQLTVYRSSHVPSLLSHAGWVSHPQALHLRQTFGRDVLGLPADKGYVNISGMSALDDDTLLLADIENGRVCELRISTGTIRVLFVQVAAHAGEPTWRVSNALLVTDTSGAQQLLVSEPGAREDGPDEVRVLVTRKQVASGTFDVHTAVTLDDTHVCTNCASWLLQ